MIWADGILILSYVAAAIASAGAVRYWDYIVISGSQLAIYHMATALACFQEAAASLSGKPDLSPR
jgi:hypothetical protein